MPTEKAKSSWNLIEIMCVCVAAERPVSGYTKWNIKIRRKKTERVVLRCVLWAHIYVSSTTVCNALINVEYKWVNLWSWSDYFIRIAYTQVPYTLQRTSEFQRQKSSVLKKQTWWKLNEKKLANNKTARKLLRFNAQIKRNKSRLNLICATTCLQA